MSSETILPPEGPEGPKKQLQYETSALLTQSPDKCNGCTAECQNTTETSRSPIPRDHASDEQGHMTEKNNTHEDLVRNENYQVNPLQPPRL